MGIELKRIKNYLWEVPRSGNMRVPARIYASRRLLEHIRADNAAQQAANVAELPGIVNASLAMPDIHWGYGFPIGGVAAFDIDEGVVSPGGVGYDINCGVRLLASKLTADQVRPRMTEILEALFQAVPSGVGASGAVSASDADLKRAAKDGARWAVSEGFGTEQDLAHIEENGCLAGAGPEAVSQRAWQRGRDQLGTLGSGNHFLELGVVSEIYDQPAAAALGLEREQVTLSIHCGSRGFGHQICEDYLGVMDRAVRKHKLALPDRQLACAPVESEEGQTYLRAMRCAVNYAFANRQVIASLAGDALCAALGMDAVDAGLRCVYEVAHNIAKLETHEVEGRTRTLCVHRKGATRAFAPGRPEVPDRYRAVGQPVLIPGDMGRYSYVLVGTQKAMLETFGSTCHGAGRAMSRHQAAKAGKGRDIFAELAERGVRLRVRSRRTVAEEMPEAYKDVADVVDVCDEAGISRKVAQLRPLGCIKG